MKMFSRKNDEDVPSEPDLDDQSGELSAEVDTAGGPVTVTANSERELDDKIDAVLGLDDDS